MSRSFECPVCGAEVPAKARACPECGADERTGWNEDATRYDGLDLPDSEFRPESDVSKDRKGFLSRTQLAWKVIGIVLIVALVVLSFLGR